MSVYFGNGGDMGATMTPGENMNLQAQLFMQLQKNGEVGVRRFVDELSEVLIENYSILCKQPILNYSWVSS